MVVRWWEVVEGMTREAHRYAWSGEVPQSGKLAHTRAVGGSRGVQRIGHGGRKQEWMDGWIERKGTHRRTELWHRKSESWSAGAE